MYRAYTCFVEVVLCTKKPFAHDTRPPAPPQPSRPRPVSNRTPAPSPETPGSPHNDPLHAPRHALRPALDPAHPHPSDSPRPSNQAHTSPHADFTRTWIKSNRTRQGAFTHAHTQHTVTSLFLKRSGYVHHDPCAALICCSFAYPIWNFASPSSVALSASATFITTRFVTSPSAPSPNVLFFAFCTKFTIPGYSQ